MGLNQSSTKNEVCLCCLRVHDQDVACQDAPWNCGICGAEEKYKELCQLTLAHRTKYPGWYKCLLVCKTCYDFWESE